MWSKRNVDINGLHISEIVLKHRITVEIEMKQKEIMKTLGEVNDEEDYVKDNELHHNNTSAS